MSGVIILAILYGAVSLLYFVYMMVLFFLGEKIDSHIKVVFPVIHAYLYKNELKLLSLGAVAIMTIVIMFGLMQGAIWAIVAAILLSAWEVVLAVKFYHPRKERINAAGHLVIHATIVVYLIIVVIH